MRLVGSLGIGLLVVGIAGAAAPLAAQGPAAGSATHGIDAAVAVRLGTLGLGFELGKQLLDHISARVGANFGSYNKNGKEHSDLTYDVHLKLKAAEFLVDLAPRRRGNFHFTVGLLTNPVSLKANGVPTAAGMFTINHHDYTSAQVGTLSAEAKFPGASPYFGLGFGTPARKGGRVKFLFDLGASIGTAKLSLSATGAQSTPGLQTDLDAERDKTQDDLDKYAKIYPVLAFGLAVHF